MPLLRLDNVLLQYGPQVLLDHINLTIHKGQRFGLLGRNGTGKSSFLKLLAGTVHCDSGEIWTRPHTKIAYLDQELPLTEAISVFDFVAQGLGEAGKLLQDFHKCSLAEPTPQNLNKLQDIQQQIEALDAWSLQQTVERTLTQLQLPADKLLSELSGGWRRRAALAQTLVSAPDLLLLDEPTNHLDIEAIQWLENTLLNFAGAVVIITHDREFLQSFANHILELDRGNLRNWEGDYRGFLSYREQQLAAEETANQEFDKKLAQEERWIRQGIKARRTRNEGRVRALEKMRDTRRQRRDTLGKAAFDVEKAENSGKIVIEASNIACQFGEQVVIKDFSTLIMRGDRIGLIGANGSGKSTLLKILLGDLQANSGEVKRGTKLQVAYFDQLRSQLDPEKSVIDNLSEGRDFIDINGKRRHIISYLQDFLFTPDRVRQPVRSLSGGEQNRLILAYLFSKPSNVLVLDEPTNDLDMETLELLEELLTDYTGTVLLVSHDRRFLDNVVTSTLVFSGDGEIESFVGGYRDWTAAQQKRAQQTAVRNTAKPGADTSAKQSKTKKKLSYKQQRELDELPKSIEHLENHLAQLTQQTQAEGFYQQEHDEVTNLLAQLSAVQEKLDALYLRWTELE
jgi:ATP-binding cassette subfamily F protein uup